MIGAAERGEVMESRLSQVDLWLLDPEQISALAPLADVFLPEAERRKGLTLRDEHARTHWAGRQAALRLVLGSYLGLDPGAVRLSADTNGKPELKGQGRLRFSISACGGWWLAAFSDQEVGVDLESIRSDVGLQTVAQTWFNEDELACLQATVQEKERLRIFYRTWTRKEALLKLRGTGLAGLRSLRDQEPGDPAWVEDLDLHEGLAASLALPRSPDLVRRRVWTTPVKDGDRIALPQSMDAFTPAFPAHGSLADIPPEEGGRRSVYMRFESVVSEETECLRRQTAISLSLELPKILVTLPRGGRFVDLLCGIGLVADAVAQACPDALVYGFDADPQAVEQSVKNFGSGHGLSFFCRRVEQGPPPGFPLADAAVLRMALLQVPDPKRTLEAARAWLKPGGILHVLEPDDRAISTEPVLPWLSDLLDLMQSAQAHRGGDRRLGKELPSLLASAGWSILGQEQHILDPIATAAALPKAFLPVAEFYLSEAESMHLAPSESIERLRRGLSRVKENGLTRASIPIFHVWAQSFPAPIL